MIHRMAPIVLSALLAACGEQAAESTAEPAATVAPPSQEQQAAAAPQITRHAAPDSAGVYIVSPADGDVVTNPVRVVFGLRGAGVAPAGIDKPDTGHHHLLIDADLPPLDAPIPADDQHRHFGMGQTETELTLPPGEHRLQLLLGDNLHVPHDPPLLSAPVTIQVQR